MEHNGKHVALKNTCFKKNKKVGVTKNPKGEFKSTDPRLAKYMNNGDVPQAYKEYTQSQITIKNKKNKILLPA